MTNGQKLYLIHLIEEKCESEEERNLYYKMLPELSVKEASYYIQRLISQKKYRTVYS